MTNETLLREAIAAKGLKIEFIAKQIGITSASFRNKTANRTEFTASEITKLTGLLGLTKAQRDLIFLSKG